MPTQWTLQIALRTELPDNYRYDVLHALACAFFEQPDSDHDAEHKPFTVRLNTPTPAGSTLTLAWLPDDPPPTTSIPTAVRLGPHRAEVIAFTTKKTPLTEFDAILVPNRARYRAVSPVKFRHHGRDYPLPDPYLTYASLARRYQVVHAERFGDDTIRELLRSVVVYHHEIHTRHFTWHGSRSAGFVGTVTFGLPRTCASPTKRLFAILNRFATMAGIGHGTTHGLGAVEVDTPTRTACTKEAANVDSGG